MGRGRTHPGPRGGASASPMPPSLPLRRAGVVGILCAGRVSRPRRARGAYNNELAAARAEPGGRGAPRARGTAVKNFLKKVLDTAGRANEYSILRQAGTQAHGGPQAPAGNLENRILWMEFYEARQGFGGTSPKRSYGP